MKLSAVKDESISGLHIESTSSNVLWGLLPCKSDLPIASVDSGDIVTIDTVSHEGLMEDQGRDPLAWFASRGMDANLVPLDAIEIAKNYLLRDPASAGPHIVTGPIEIKGAQPGDILKVKFLSLLPRTPFGVVSSRHGYGALPTEYPSLSHHPLGETSLEEPGLVSVLCTIEERSGIQHLSLAPRGNLPPIEFPLAPFLGLIGVTPSSDLRLNSIPPGNHGGNLDIRDLVMGACLYLPIQVAGAGFYVGDPHYAQGHGEVALTAVEAPLRATLRLTIVKAKQAINLLGTLTRPFAESDQFWYCVGLDRDLNEAMRSAVREALRFLGERFGLPREEAYAYLSAAADFVVTQVVDDVKGVHCQIRKKDFKAYLV